MSSKAAVGQKGSNNNNNHSTQRANKMWLSVLFFSSIFTQHFFLSRTINAPCFFRYIIYLSIDNEMEHLVS